MRYCNGKDHLSNELISINYFTKNSFVKQKVKHHLNSLFVLNSYEVIQMNNEKSADTKRNNKYKRKNPL